VVDLQLLPELLRLLREPLRHLLQEDRVILQRTFLLFSLFSDLIVRRTSSSSSGRRTRSSCPRTSGRSDESSGSDCGQKAEEGIFVGFCLGFLIYRLFISLFFRQKNVQKTKILRFLLVAVAEG
jgi:hypothetical protein